MLACNPNIDAPNLSFLSVFPIFQPSVSSPGLSLAPAGLGHLTAFHTGLGCPTHCGAPPGSLVGLPLSLSTATLNGSPGGAGSTALMAPLGLGLTGSPIIRHTTACSGSGGVSVGVGGATGAGGGCGASVGGNAAGNGNGWCLFVYNLAPDTEEATLWRLFGPFGAVRSVKLARESPSSNGGLGNGANGGGNGSLVSGAGKCRGFGFITMTNYAEASYAIQNLNGCVHFYTFSLPFFCI
ncbi:unnamed protein product [Protopolystoma xenopodis]|uniref:RRM domain-containing protein n=1 Tax=Protopolystoma xenopodis TaxID=117903 RepID=A0A448WT39_9PLAT|nr:unnamed protein product [Protopolystoma xenopodis]